MQELFHPIYMRSGCYGQEKGQQERYGTNEMKLRKDMKIFIVGGGEIGRSLAVQLSRDGYELTMIDKEESVVSNISNSVDAISYQGNGASYAVLKNLNASEADIFIAVTNSDELNILSCFTAHMLGAKHTIARIRNLQLLWKYTDFFGSLWQPGLKYLQAEELNWWK